MTNASGLAAAIRGATETETFDLAGQNVNTITQNITSAFSSPFDLEEMIRITFITGAGKLGRQKYDENAAKAVTSALRDLGFEEDRGASCVNECAGSFKLQHDTGKNLKTVVVFPKIQSSGGNNNNNNNNDGDNDGWFQSGGGGGGDSSSFFPKDSLEEKVAMCSAEVFKSMIKNRCQSWSQKKKCMAVLAEIKTALDQLDAKLLQGTPLSDSEQTFYDAVSSTVLEEKQEFVKEQMHQQVDEGAITNREKVQLLEQVSERLTVIAKEIKEAEETNKPKKVEKLQGLEKKATARQEKLSQITPKPAPPLKHQADILKLRKELQPLIELEEGAKGRLLSVKETQSLARKEEILEEIAELEEKSRGWFEDDQDFALRVNACNAVWASQNKGKKKASGGGKGGGGSSAPAGNAWHTTTASKPKAKGFGAASRPAAKKTTARGGGVFGAMMMDSDSD